MLRLPSPTPISKEYEFLTQPIITPEIVRNAVDSLLLDSLTFHVQLWTKDKKQRAMNIRYMKKHPEEFTSREKSARMIISLFAPRRGDADFDDARDVTPPQKMTVERLREMGLTERQLKQIAGIEEEK